MANNPIDEPMLTGSDSDEVSSANPVHASALRLNDTFSLKCSSVRPGGVGWVSIVSG